MFCIAALRPRTLGAVASLVAALCTTVQAAPTIANISPRGLQIGEPTTLTITGSDLSADAQVVSEAKIAKQSVKPGAKANQVQIEVTLDSATQPGLYALRLANANGISSPVMVGVDHLPQRPFDAKLGKLPA